MLGGKPWHQSCNFPRAGVGLHHLRILNRNELGHPFSVYGFYDGNYLRTKNFLLTNRMATGLTYGLKKHNPLDSIPNDVIGTRLNAFIELGLGIGLRINDLFYLEPGFRFSHFSNGNMRKPQRGINVASYDISIRTMLSNQKITPVKMCLDKCPHRHEWVGFVAASTRQIEFRDEDNTMRNAYDMNYLMANLNLGYLYEATRRLKLGGGFDFIYDGINGQQEAAFRTGIPMRGSVPLRDKLALAFFVGGESAIDKLSIVGTLGYVVAQRRFQYSTPRFEQRLGFKYHFYRNVFAGVNIRAYNFRAAKAVEFNVGFRKTLSLGGVRSGNL